MSEFLPTAVLEIAAYFNQIFVSVFSSLLRKLDTDFMEEMAPSVTHLTRYSDTIWFGMQNSNGSKAHRKVTFQNTKQENKSSIRKPSTNLSTTSECLVIFFIIFLS